MKIKLTSKNIKVGLEVIEEKHPEYGILNINTDLDGKTWTVEKGGFGNGKLLFNLNDYILA